MNKLTQTTTLSWHQITIPSDADDAEDISNFLTLLGAVAVSFADAQDQPLYEPALNTTPLWQHTRINALFPIATDIEAVIHLLKEKNLPVADISIVVDQDWQRQCREDFKPQCFGEKLWICPSWSTLPDNATNAAVVTLDPGLAFGTGTHPTTALCLTWLAQHIQPGQHVIDFGCGSGILALAALKLGAGKVWAIDNDPQALQATEENARCNNIRAENLSILFPQQIPIELQADVIVANILAQPLISLAKQLSSWLKPQGYLVLSGILIEQADTVKAAYDNTLKECEVAVDGEWARLSGIKI